MVVLLAIYLLLSVAGLTLIKMGANLQGGIALGLSDGAFNLSIGWYTIIGFICYIVSFFLYMALIQKNNLTYIAPIATGLSYALAMASGFFILHELVTPIQWCGIGVILIGIVMMNIK